jgi:Kef-type K+ transport system membrane component KefB
VLVAIGAKAIGCGALTKICGFSRRESLRVGVGMISCGDVGLIVAGYGLMVSGTASLARTCSRRR